MNEFTEALGLVNIFSTSRNVVSKNQIKKLKPAVFLLLLLILNKSVKKGTGKSASDLNLNVRVFLNDTLAIRH